MPGISNRLAGICLFSLSIVIAGQSGHAQTAAQNRIAQPIVAAQVSPLQGTVHPLARPQYDQGPVASSMQLQGMTLNFNRSTAHQASPKNFFSSPQTTPAFSPLT